MQVVAIDQAVLPAIAAGIAQPRRALRLRDPVNGGHVLRRQHPFARLQSYPVPAFQALENALGLPAPARDDLRQFFEQGLGHQPGRRRVRSAMKAKLSSH